MSAGFIDVLDVRQSLACAACRKVDLLARIDQVSIRDAGAVDTGNCAIAIAIGIVGLRDLPEGIARSNDVGARQRNPATGTGARAE